MKRCNICPRGCTFSGKQNGFCGNTQCNPPSLKIAHACLHFGEEPPITGRGGSGAIFVTGCNLRCSFCQNYRISHEGLGQELSAQEFARICMQLQDAGAENINIVTGSHAIPALAAGLEKAKSAGLALPVCWNSSAYESVSSLSRLRGLVDIWLPDLKTLNREMSARLFRASDYPDVATEAILHMLRSAPLVFDSLDFPADSPDARAAGVLKSGVIIRHLVLPSRIEDSIRVLDWLKKHADKKAIISVMTQYTPIQHDEPKIEMNIEMKTEAKIEPNRFLSQTEYGEIRELLAAYNFENIFCQELVTDSSWLPDFRLPQVFTEATPVWTMSRT